MKRFLFVINLKKIFIILFLLVASFLFFNIESAEAAAFEFWDKQYQANFYVDEDIASIVKLSRGTPEQIAGRQMPVGAPWACECTFNFKYQAKALQVGTGGDRWFVRTQIFYFTSDWPFLKKPTLDGYNEELKLKVGLASSFSDMCKLVYSVPTYKLENVCLPEGGCTDVKVPGVNSEKTDPVLVGSEVNKVFNNFGFLDIPSCKIVYPPTDICCCDIQDSGALSRTNVCKKSRGSISDSTSCTGLEFDVTDPNDPLFGKGKYRPIAMPASKDCKDAEREQNIPNPDKQEFGISLEKLQADAAAKLNPLKFTDLPSLIGRLLKFIPMYMGMIAMIMYIWAGFLWMSAQGNSEKTTKAKTIIVWTSLGVVAMLASYMLISFVFKSVLQINV